MSASMNWGQNTIRKGMMTYKDKVRFALKQVAQYWGAVFERYAKEEAPWTDRTANARQSLHTWIEELADDTVSLYLSHGMEYGRFLETVGASSVGAETGGAGKYAIIWPTIEAHLDAIAKMLKGIFG